MGDANETDGPVPARRVKRLLLICFVMSLAGTVIGAVVKELAEQHRMAGAIVPVLGVLAGVLFIAGPCVVFVFWLRWQMPTAFQNFDREGLTGRDRRAVVRAISRGREVPVEHRAAGLRMARRMG
ncbi:MAG TPA: hypothetical protein VHZ97_14245, partial [Pseudonocardiaceae bacterium]|nr:hypothetical protein [Pseudonocardiaceae bacterium]